MCFKKTALFQNLQKEVSNMNDLLSGVESQREALLKECGADPSQITVATECKVLHEKLVSDVQVSICLVISLHIKPRFSFKIIKILYTKQ